jgi:polyphosphate kinase
MFEAIRQKDMLLHHPCDDIVVSLPKRQIQCGWQSNRRFIAPHVQPDCREALCEAAEDGKSVTALVEPKARFGRSGQYPPVALSSALARMWSTASLI